MGTPHHYGLELPERCLALVDALWKHVEAENDGGRFGGPLTTTFLLAMATPAIVLPIERIQKHLRRGDVEGLADDRHLERKSTEAISRVFGDGIPFSQCPLFLPDSWSYARSPNRFNVARGLPAELAELLAGSDARTRAATEQSLELVLALRNALAHGGVLYLNREGYSGHVGEPVEAIAFVGEKWVDGKCVGLHVLRVTERNFRECLRSWVAWLSETRLSRELAA